MDNKVSGMNYNPFERHQGLDGDIHTMPSGWDLSSMPGQKSTGEEISKTKKPQATQDSENEAQPRLQWLVDKNFDEEDAPTHPYFSPY